MSKSELWIKEVILYGTLLTVFGAAWFADSSPSSSRLAIAVGVGFAALEIAVLFALSAKLRLRLHHVVSSGLRYGLLKQAPRPSRHAGSEEFEAQQLELRHLTQVSRVNSLVMPQLFESERSASLNLPGELNDWKLALHPTGFFALKAGAFVIEHFHGNTNIKVRDPSRITIEIDDPNDDGSMEKYMQRGIKAPSYQ